MKDFLKKHFLLIGLITFALGVFIVTARINIFRYNNFDVGKFDLGNMTQMVWNTLHGRPLQLTDYFGTNLVRWSMSHVDPILLLFVPIFALYQHPLTLVFSQIIIVLSSCVALYLIAEMELKSKLGAFLFGMAFLFYPALGFLNAWTGFHGVTAGFPFFLWAFYVYERMYKSNDFTKKGIITFWVLLVITMTGKEQVPLYIALYGLFIAIYRFKEKVPFPQKNNIKTWILNLFKYDNVRLGMSMFFVGIVWFVVAFFVIIPAYAPARVQGFQKFAQEIGIDTDVTTDVENDNYFLSRYEAFGDSYSEVIIGMLTKPKILAQVMFGGDKPDNLRMTLEPIAYTSLLYPPIFFIALPDFLINYATSAGGIGISEIINHRISMLIPILFLASLYGISAASRNIETLLRSKLRKKQISILFTFVVLIYGINTSFTYENPVYLWLTQAIQKRVKLPAVFAKTASDEINLNELQVGDRHKLSALDNKDRECAEKIVRMIPDDATVSGPDYLGAHLSMRETYAIFPALHNSADYVIIDVFAQKILRILDVDVTLVRDVVADVIKDENYKLKLGCGNLFVYQNVGPHGKPKLLPLQQKLSYDEKLDLEIFQGLTVVDLIAPSEFDRGELYNIRFVYTKKEEEALDDYVLFMSFIHSDSRDLYQVANLPSFSLNQLRNWDSDKYYLEDLDLVLPEFLEKGEYKMFIGMTNNIRTRSIYLGDVTVK